MNYRDIIVFDFETGSRNPHKTQPTQIAAIALHGRRLTLQPGGVFNSEIRPILDDKKAIEAGFDPIEDEALQITGKNRKHRHQKVFGKSLRISATSSTLEEPLIRLRLQQAITSLALTCQSSKGCVTCTARLTLEGDRLCLIQFLS